MPQWLAILIGILVVVLLVLILAGSIHVGAR